MEEIYKVKSVMPLQDYCLSVGFVNGEKKQYDVKPLFEKWECFNSLIDIKGLFELVTVDQSGYGILWNEFIDLSCNELYFNGTSL